MLIKNTIQLNDGTQFFIQLSIDTIKLQVIDDDNHDSFINELKDFNITIWKDKTIRYNNLHSIGRISTDNIIEIYGLSQYIKSNKMHFLILHYFLRTYNYRIKKLDLAIDIIGLCRERFTIVVNTNVDRFHTKPSLQLDNHYLEAVNGIGTNYFYIPFHQKELLTSLKPLINKLKKEHFTNVIKVCDTSTNFKSFEVTEMKVIEHKKKTKLRASISKYNIDTTTFFENTTYNEYRVKIKSIIKDEDIVFEKEDVEVYQKIIRSTIRTSKSKLNEQKTKTPSHLLIKAKEQKDYDKITRLIKEAKLELDYESSTNDKKSTIYTKLSKKNKMKLYDKVDKFLNNKYSKKKIVRAVKQLQKKYRSKFSINDFNTVNDEIHRLEYTYNFTTDDVITLEDSKLVDLLYSQVKQTKLRFFNLSQNNKSFIHQYIKSNNAKNPKYLWELENIKGQFIEYMISREDIEQLIREFKTSCLEFSIP